ncbi:Exosome complex component rrp4 [Podospora pseudopauciseta]|uniref:Exosome complex component rrp4 n=2 Tax=Podospora TaxID=5144 RepID=A0ABR0HBW0_9PEZI|nr:Exosome complex component rrp4 [Podospora pseudopauciseta]KAK4676717.1 Exosome complex component rrp4 [Podospora pseudoanserina]
MPITILPPKPSHPPPSPHDISDADSELSSDDGGGGAHLDFASLGLPSHQKSTHPPNNPLFTNLVTPGTLITPDHQWMRGHGTYIPPSTTNITSSLAGITTRTNKLISVSPLRARYTPEVGDLVVGRVLEVQAKRWRVDINSIQLASLPLSAINLPGGILRKRTETDELQIRTFFAEGDLVVAEVQQLFQDGGAVLHTRSLKYGKLRNGLFVALSGQGGGSGVVRSRRQVWTMEGQNGGGKMDVILGVNGYVWISKHIEQVAKELEQKHMGITNMEESVSAGVYSSQNDFIDSATMREIARLRNVVTALVENGCRVDEDMVIRGYAEACEMAMLGETGAEDIYLGGQRGEELTRALRN